MDKKELVEVPAAKEIPADSLEGIRNVLEGFSQRFGTGNLEVDFIATFVAVGVALLFVYWISSMRRHIPARQQSSAAGPVVDMNPDHISVIVNDLKGIVNQMKIEHQREISNLRSQVATLMKVIETRDLKSSPSEERDYSHLEYIKDHEPVDERKGSIVDGNFVSHIRSAFKRRATGTFG